MKPVKILKKCVIYGKPFKEGDAKVTEKEYLKGLENKLLKDADKPAK